MVCEMSARGFIEDLSELKWYKRNLGIQNKHKNVKPGIIKGGKETRKHHQFAD